MKISVQLAKHSRDVYQRIRLLNYLEVVDDQSQKQNSPYKCMSCFMYRRRDLNPHGHYCPLDFKSNVSTDSTTSAWT